MNIPLLYIPSFYGDIRLERVTDQSTRVIVAQATPLEQTALRALGEYAVKKKWLVDTTSIVVNEGSFLLNAGVVDIQKRLSKEMKPGREVVTVVRYTDGKMEEIIEYPTKTPGPSSAAAPSSPPATEAAEKPPAAPKAAAAVAKPYRGCPAPAFAHAELRANRVLETFLTPEQREDFRTHDSFITIGGATGHRYMVTSRTAPERLHKFGGRSLFDLDDDEVFCVHDWDVPAAEEMLALHLLASLPQHELYLRRLEEESV